MAWQKQKSIQAGAGGGRFVDGYLAYLLAQASQRIPPSFICRCARPRPVGHGMAGAGQPGRQRRRDHRHAGRAGHHQAAHAEQGGATHGADGLVERTGVRAPTGARRACITTKGRNLIAGLCEQALQHQKAVLAPFGEERATLLIEMLEVLMTEHVPLEMATAETDED